MPMRRCEMTKALGIYSNSDRRWSAVASRSDIPSVATTMTTIMVAERIAEKLTA
jgi:hypothetical protein